MINSKEDLTEFKTKLQDAANEKLCEIIVASKYLGIMKEQAILCMEELARRRANGDVFDFEKRIEEMHESLPKYKINIKEILAPSMNKIFGIFK